MKHILFFIFCFSTLASSAQDAREMMYVIYSAEEECGYVTDRGDTVIPCGKYGYCLNDSSDYAIVATDSSGKYGFPAIDSKGTALFYVFSYDNGPDYVEDGLMRIIDNGKIGYASESGEVVIAPLYKGALPFEDGKAQVSIHATKVHDGEHWFWTDTDWIFIDKNGNRVEE